MIFVGLTFSYLSCREKLLYANDVFAKERAYNEVVHCRVEYVSQPSVTQKCRFFVSHVVDALLSNIQYMVTLWNPDRSVHEYFYAFVSNAGTSV